MAQPIKHARTGIYQTRRRVPADLRAALGWEFKKSLGTRDLATAKRLHVLALAESDTLFDQVRAGMAGEPLNGRDALILAGRWFEQERAAMEASGRFDKWLATGSTSVAADGEEHTPYVTLEWALDGEPLDPEDVRQQIAKTLKAAKRPMPAPESTEYKTLAGAFAEHILKLSELALARHEGNWKRKVETLSHESLSVGTEARKQRGMPLLELFEGYASYRLVGNESNRAINSTVTDYRALMREFVELFGDLPVHQITRDVVRQYRVEVTKLPVRGDGIRKLTAKQKIAMAQAEGLTTASPGTVNNKLRALSTVMSYGVQFGHLDTNPVIASGLLREAAKAVSRKRATAPRKYYTRDELADIFGSPVFAQGWEPPRAKFGKAWFWLPLLLYYTGARVEEIAQLAAKDVKSSGAGPFLSILNTEGEDDGDRGVKTEGSRRDVPLHPDLVRLGFLTYAESIPDGGQLFPALTKCPKGYYSTNFAKRWGHYLRSIVGLVTTADPCHGFRHAFKTFCRDVRIEEEVHDAITGHSGGNRVARGYGAVLLETLAREIARYPSVPVAGFVPAIPEAKAA